MALSHHAFQSNFLKTHRGPYQSWKNMAAYDYFLFIDNFYVLINLKIFQKNSRKHYILFCRWHWQINRIYFCNCCITTEDYSLVLHIIPVSACCDHTRRPCRDIFETWQVTIQYAFKKYSWNVIFKLYKVKGFCFTKL